MPGERIIALAERCTAPRLRDLWVGTPAADTEPQRWVLKALTPDIT